MFDDGSLYFPIGNDADFLQWLENVEWDKRDWIEPLGTGTGTGAQGEGSGAGPS